MAKSLHTNAWRHLLRQLIDLRRAAGLTQEDVAKQIGRTQSFVSKIERGERRLDVLEFCQWAQIVNGDPTEIIAGVMQND